MAHAAHCKHSELLSADPGNISLILYDAVLTVLAICNESFYVHGCN